MDTDRDTGSDTDPRVDVEQELRKRDAAWSRAAHERAPVEEVLEYWTDDAVVLPAGMPPVAGKDALRAYVEGSYEIPGFAISWTTDRVEVSQDGTMGWILGSNLVEWTAEDGTPVRQEGRVVTTWRREAGTWRCTTDIWNAL